MTTSLRNKMKQYEKYIPAHNIQGACFLTMILHTTVCGLWNIIKKALLKSTNYAIHKNVFLNA